MAGECSIQKILVHKYGIFMYISTYQICIRHPCMTGQTVFDA